MALLTVYEIVASIVAISALLGAFANTYFQFRHNRLSVRPLPEISIALHDDLFEFTLENLGHGPMIIQTIALRDDRGTTLAEGGLNTFFKDFFGQPGESEYNLFISTHTLKKESSILLYKFTPDASFSNKALLSEKLSSLRLFIRYRDLYDQIYSTTLEIPYE